MKLIYTILFSFVFLTTMYCQPANNNCSGAVNIPVNSSTTCVTTLTATSSGATQSQAGCTGNADDDVWFIFTATSGNHTITVTPTTMNDVVLQFFTGSCAGLTSAGCFDATAGSSAETVYYNGGLAGTTYYVRVYSYGSSANAGTFSICVKTIPDPAGTNCMSGTQVCSNSNIAGNASGAGSEELTATSGGCLGAGGEVNSSWFYLNVGTTGTFQFTITPSNGSDDYDFAIWGPTNVCPPTVAPIRCNYAAYPRFAGCGTNTNPTGLSGTPGFTSASACQDRPYLDRLNVTAGEVYILLVNGFTPSASPFNMSFGGTGGLSCVPVVILPIELLNFNVISRENSVDIKWTTATEINNDYFVVERSVDAINFDPINVVKGAGNSDNKIAYSVIDNEPLQGLSYYRLKQVDKDEKFSYSNILSVDFINARDFNFEIVPNPSIENQMAKIQLNFVPKNSIDIQIFDLNGVLVYETKTKPELAEVELLTNLYKGVYIVKILNDDFIQTKRMIIK